jgi:hypothetical protein
MFLSKDIVEAFASKRNNALNFPFLKENGELLSIACTSGMLLEPSALKLYASFYDRSLNICETYPSYFRFVLRLILDLEDLGMNGARAGEIATFVREYDFLHYETSDVRRLEILYLLERGLGLTAEEKDVRQDVLKSVEKFAAQPKFYTRFNKPLFYDLTHIVFFLTHYGTRAWPFQNSIVECLLNVGVLSFLDEDYDLLAEVCICLTFLNEEVPPFWMIFMQSQLAAVNVQFDSDVQSALNNAVDDYHPYLVSNWLLALNGEPVFAERFDGRKPSFVSKPAPGLSSLAEISKVVHDYKVNGAISDSEARRRLNTLSPVHMELIAQAADAIPNARELLEIYTFGLIS